MYLLFVNTGYMALGSLYCILPWKKDSVSVLAIAVPKFPYSTCRKRTGMMLPPPRPQPYIYPLIFVMPSISPLNPKFFFHLRPFLAYTCL